MEESKKDEKREQPPRKTPQMNEQKKEAPRMPILFRCLLIFVLALSLTYFATYLMKTNQLREETDRINDQITEREENVELLRYLIDSPVDDAYIIRIARERLNLVFPDEKIFYNDLTTQN